LGKSEAIRFPLPAARMIAIGSDMRAGNAC
jgi:hypothetical protein